MPGTAFLRTEGDHQPSIETSITDSTMHTSRAWGSLLGLTAHCVVVDVLRVCSRRCSVQPHKHMRHIHKLLPSCVNGRL